MKLRPFFATAFFVLPVATPTLHAQTSPMPPPAAPLPKQYEATVTRTTSGRIVNERGFATGAHPLKKGSTYDIITGDMSDAILSVNGARIKVSRSDLAIAEKRPRPAEAPDGALRPPMPPAPPEPPFEPGGTLVIFSARYSLEGNSPRNVKTKLEKLIPAEPLQAPVAILVSDELSRAAQNQGGATVIRDSNGRVTVLEARKNILTVEYSYLGKVLRKQAEEGTTLTLP